MPTYLFLASFLILLAMGVGRAVLAGGHPRPVIPPPPLAPAAGAVSAWLLIRAFASGCTAMTGVEAVSNGISAFRDPAVEKAHGTLTAIVVSLAALLGGVAYLAHAFGIGAMDQTQARLSERPVAARRGAGGPRTLSTTWRSAACWPC